MNINTKSYIEKYIKIRDKSGKIIDLKLNQGQLKLYEAIKKQSDDVELLKESINIQGQKEIINNDETMEEIKDDH